MQNDDLTVKNTPSLYHIDRFPKPENVIKKIKEHRSGKSFDDYLREAINDEEEDNVVEEPSVKKEPNFKSPILWGM